MWWGTFANVATIYPDSIKVCFSLQYLADIEDHLGVTIDQVDEKLKVPVNEFDGKVTYGQKRKNDGKEYGGCWFS